MHVLVSCVGWAWSNQEGYTSQEPVRPASWQQRQRHKPHCYSMRTPWAMSGSHAHQSGSRQGKGEGSKPGEGDLEVLLEKVHARDSCDDLERGAEENGPVSGEALLEKREVRNMGERLDFEPPLTTVVESSSTVRQAQPTRESHGRSPRL